ncbi:MAG: TetR/AcrR family transcriptional regulator [Opitutales bacterium]|nr:TetR/AcrR family transcriptional regulator [Opitutales bacterium]
MTTREKNALKTRQKIIDAAAELVLQNRFDDMTIDDLTRACGVAKGTFYTYFKHKDEIVFEVCRSFFARIETNMQNMRGKSIIARLSYYFSEFINEVERHGVNMTRAWIKGVIDPSTAPKNYDTQKWRYDCEMLQNILRSAVESGELKKSAPVELLTHIIISQLYGMMTCWCMSDCEFEPKDWAKKFCDVQLKAIFGKYLTQKKG